MSDSKLASNQEVKRLRRAQAKAVMPLIGRLLDAWEQLPNDVACMDELEDLAQIIESINQGMECEE